MHFAGLLQSLHDTHFSAFMRESTWAEPIIETVHVLTLTLFFGFTVLLDLRLLGLFWRARPVSAVLRQLNGWLLAGFLIMLASGLLLFAGDPVAFWSTIFFRVKMLLLLLAGFNVLLFNRTLGRRADWGLATPTPAVVKASAIASLALWILIIAAGRAIAYALPPP